MVNSNQNLSINESKLTIIHEFAQLPNLQIFVELNAKIVHFRQNFDEVNLKNTLQRNRIDIYLSMRLNRISYKD